MLSDNVTEQVLSRKRAEELAAQLETEKEALHTHKALRALLVMAQLIGQGPEQTDASGHETCKQAGLTAQEVTHQLAELTCDVLGCQHLSITIVEPETEILRPFVVVGLSREQERQWWAEQLQQESRFTDTPDPSLVQRLQANEVVLLDMTQPPWNVFPNLHGIRTMLVAPMGIRQHLVGFLSLDYRGAEHLYTSEELELAGAAAKLAAMVIERDRLLRQCEQLRAKEMALLSVLGIQQAIATERFRIEIILWSAQFL